MDHEDSGQLPEFPERLGKELRKTETRAAGRAVVKIMLQTQPDEDTAAAPPARWMPARPTASSIAVPGCGPQTLPLALLPLLSRNVM